MKISGISDTSFTEKSRSVENFIVKQLPRNFGETEIDEIILRREIRNSIPTHCTCWSTCSKLL